MINTQLLSKTLSSALFAAAIMFGSSAMAQVKIGNRPTIIDPSAVLDVESTNKGFLPPRVALQTITDGTTIVNPATGLLVYNTNVSLKGGTGIFINTGTPASPEWGKLQANTSTSGVTAEKMRYRGVVDPGKTVSGGILEFRFVTYNSDLYAVQARLINQPTGPVTITGQRLGWFGSGDFTGTLTINSSWTTVDWNQWKQIDLVGKAVAHTYYLDVSADEAFYRVSTSVQPNQFALAVETF